MTLLLAIRSFGSNWSADAWHARFSARLPGHEIVKWPAEPVVPAAVRYAAAWKPPHGLLSQYPNLVAIFNLGAGVDALLEDPNLPGVPIVRVVDRNLTRRMTEYVVLHVLLHHRAMPRLAASQARRHWDAPDQPFAGSVRVGIMGLGEVARDSADVLLRLGFRVSGWSRPRHRDWQTYPPQAL